MGSAELGRHRTQPRDRTTVRGPHSRQRNTRTGDRQLHASPRAVGDTEIKERSTIGLARVHEALSQLGEAQQEYEQLLKQWPKSIYATEARQRIDDLSKQSTKEFYDWFASQNVKALGGGGAARAFLV